MEGNKDEALRCIEIATEKMQAGNKEGAIKFLEKSIRLFPTDRATQLLAKYTSSNKNEGGSTSSSSSTSTTHKSSSTTSTTSSTSTNSNGSEETKIKYTKEQVEAIQRIKRCKNHYEVLEIQKTATETDIKKAYRKLALQMHPDKNHAPGADEAFKRVSQAFSTLSDSSKRSMYDLHGDEPSAGGMGGFGMGRPSGFQRGGNVYFDEEEISPEDIFNMFFGIPTRGGVRHRGPGGVSYQYYSTGFGGSPRHVHRTGGANARAANGAATRAGGQGESSIFSLLMLVIPLLYILLSFFGGGGGTPALYSLSRTSGFTVEREFAVSPNIVAEYYVRDNRFEDTLKDKGISLDKLEEEIRGQWVSNMQNICRKKFLYETYKNSFYGMQFREEYYRYQRAGLFEHCDQLLKENIIVYQ